MTSHAQQRFVFIFIAIALAAATTASAHHSFAMYNTQTPVTLKGKVTSFRWVSPHAVFSIATDGSTAQPSATWAIELSSPANMTRLGWTHSTLHVGDHVEVTASPLRDGSHGAACRQLKLLDTGKALACGAGAAIYAGEKPGKP